MATGSAARGGRRPARRRFGEIDRQRSGRYRARYTGPDGARHSASGTFETREYAQGWLASEARLIELDAWAPPAERARAERRGPEYTLEVLYARYLERRARPLSAASRTDYERDWRLRIAPHWGADRDITTITHEEVWQWRQGPLAKEGRRDHAALALFRSMLRRAYEWGWIPRSPAEGVTIPRRRQAVTQRHAFTLEQVRDYLRAADPRHVAMLATVALAGLRSGEVRALRWQDVDLRRRELHVRQSVDFGRDETGAWVASLKPPKTAAGEHVVPFGEELAKILTAHYEAHPGPPSALVFPAPDGRPYGPSEPDRRHNHTLARMGLRMPQAEKQRRWRRGEPVPSESTIRLHDLRASYAAWLFSQGYEVPEVMALGGWSDSRMPLEVYARVFPSRIAEVGRCQDEALGSLDVEVA